MSAEHIHITHAEPDRFAADCGALWLALRDHHGAVAPQLGPLRGDEDGWARASAIYAELLARDGAFLLLAEAPGQDAPAGCAIVTVHVGASPTWEHLGAYGELALLSVAPAARGLGIGTRLVAAVQAELDRRGAGELRLSVVDGNLGALAFYRELGFDTFALELRRTRPAQPPGGQET